ncbi:Reverse transcriptase domain [Cinara cedri]|uniref:Reverse transcriptase domain n=1 Tax=Cinara cedri TaxID=506608 RepID=A0A5E4N1G1_9HEMI|nr:Reverse transcriptase domain [Cinara cedri]
MLKKSGANSYEQFRTLSILTQVSKILTKIINRRIEEKVKTKLTELNIGIKTGGEIISMIRFTDDIVVIAKSEVEKTILIRANDPKIKADVYIDSQKLEQVEEMAYLGSKIISDDKSLYLNNKKSLIKTHVWNVATYGFETWVINDTENKKLKAFEMWCWRRMERTNWLERKTNEEILRTVEEECILIDAIRARRWKMDMP